MSTGIVLDLETLGIAPDSVVLSIGCVPFDFEKPKTFEELISGGLYLKLSVKDQLNLGRSIEKDTLHWWKNQGEEAQKVLNPSNMDLPVEKALRFLNKFIENNTDFDRENGWAWSRGNLFDFGKLHSLYQYQEHLLPWNPFMERDIRTMIDCFTGSTRGRYKTIAPTPGFIVHNALHDAARDALSMIEIFQTILKEG